MRMGVIMMSLSLLLWLNAITTCSSINIGTVLPYDPPYTPTMCNGDAADQFPAGNFFASVSQEIWDSACGRRYRVACLSGPSCIIGAIIDVVVVDFCSACPSTFLFSTDAFSAISRSQSGKLNVQYNQI